MITPHHFPHLFKGLPGISAPLSANNSGAIHIYTTTSIIFGLANIIIPFASAGNQLAPQEIPFIVLAPIICSAIPLFPRCAIISYSGCWLTLLVTPGVYMSDTIFSNMLFYFYIGLLTTTKKASLIYFINGVSCVTIMYSNKEAFDVNNTTGLIVYLTSGILFISFGKMLDRIERFWQHRAYATESQLNRIRSDIAKEMHDLVSYSMSQTVLRARYSASNLFYPASARTEFSAIAATGADALHELRILLYALQKESGDSIPINATPLRKVQDISTSVELVTEDIEQAGFSVSYHIANNVSFTRAQTLILSRVVREIAANIIRHGDPSKPATLTVSQNENRIQLLSTNTIIDSRATTLPSSGAGLLNMRERLETLGGTLTTSTEDGEWIISATVPLSIAEEQR